MKKNNHSAIGAVALMIKLSWQLSLLTVIGLPIGFLLGKVYGILFRNLQKKIQDALAEANSLADETIGSAWLLNLNIFILNKYEAILIEFKKFMLISQ